MKLREFDYELPKNLIAQKPARPRDNSRLLVLDKKTGRMGHKHFFDLPEFLTKGDVLVLNNSKVFPARLIGAKKETGGKIEVFLLKKQKEKIWQCLIGGKVRKENLEIIFSKKLAAKILKNNQDGTWDVGFNLSGKSFRDEVDKKGRMPLPPYIKKSSKFKDQSSKSDYQTIYADEKKVGSVAAPTAGFHFTPRLMKELEKKGVHFEYVTLHVGLGTFAPVKTKKIEDHRIHSEWFEIKKSTINKILKAKKEGRRIIVVGTTSARVLESVFSTPFIKGGKNITGWTDIFIRPGYKFKIVDAMITNFHLPKSTLLMLVCAFCAQGASASGGAGIDIVKKAYAEAIRKKYRFFSYGDAMLIK